MHNKIKKCLQGIKLASRLLTSAEETATNGRDRDMTGAEFKKAIEQNPQLAERVQRLMDAGKFEQAMRLLINNLVEVA